MSKERALTSREAKELQEKYGKNQLIPEKKESILHKILGVISEPMFLLLIATAVIYFILGEPRDGAVMLIFVVGIISIEAIQEWKTDKTLNALKDLSAPHVKVIRDDKEIVIISADLVPGDWMIIEEGVKVPADGEIIKLNDLCVDESSLTGEAQGVWKVVSGNTKVPTDYWRKDYCYAGTLVTQGMATILVDKIGSATEYGKIGKNIAEAPDRPTPLEKQTSKLVRNCALIAGVFFVAVAVITYINLPDHMFKERIIESILSGITLSMAMIPEEFPVILTVFLSMGAWRLAKKNSLVRRLPSVETLGAVSVLCVDKTGTITMNRMTVEEIWTPGSDTGNIVQIMGMACETDAYDPMEKAMLLYCSQKGYGNEDLFQGELMSEYPFTNEAKMMGHVWKNPKFSEGIVVAAKGSPEKILTLCKLDEKNLQEIEDKLVQMSKQAMRVIAIAQMQIDKESQIPASLLEARLTFCGLVGLSDPPRETVKEDIAQCIKAGIRVVMITGDNGITASAIADKIGMPNSQNVITGDQLSLMSDEDLNEQVKNTNIFSRVIPEHKMRIVKAFKQNGEVVAMTGDGVNDAPALKYADIGIAMGKRGSEVSREAADLILLDDNFTTIVNTIEDGRRIYDNIRKAIGYVFVIHIPIAMASLIAPLMGITSGSLMLLPLHVVLLEVVIDPTCSIVLERQPAEKGIMDRNPRDPKEKILTSKVLVKSVIQGLVIFASSFGAYITVFKNTQNAELARTMGLSIILISNILLVQVNSSDSELVINSIKKLSKDKVMWAITLGTIMGLIVIIYTPLSGILKLAPLTLQQFLKITGISFISVLWYEIVKVIKILSEKEKLKKSKQQGQGTF